MKAIKTIVVIALSVCMVFTMMPLSTMQAMAIDEPQQTEQQETTAPAGGDGQGSDVSPGDSKGGPQEGEGNGEGKGTDDGEGTITDDPAVNDEPAVQNEAPIVKAPTRETLPSGEVSGAPSGWIWKVAGEEGDYTLTFEYTESGTPPTFAVPKDFVAGISSKLGSYKSQIKTVIVPERCTAINSRAFQNLKGLEEVEIGSTVKTIGTVVFGDNSAASNRDTKLKKVVFKTNSSGKSALEVIDAGSFTGCSALSSINLEVTSLRFIGQDAFRSCALTEVYIPDSIAMCTDSYNQNYNIKGYAFADNSKLKSVSMPALCYIPSSVGDHVFANCSGLEDVEFREVSGATSKSSNSSSLPNTFFQNDANLKTIDFSGYSKTSASSFSVAHNMFRDYTNYDGPVTSFNNFEKLILPKKNTVLAEHVFQKNEGIYSWDQFENTEYITAINYRALLGTRFTSGDMSDMSRLATIGGEAFKNCNLMTNVVIPENVTYIGSAAFMNCDSLETVRIEAKQLTKVEKSNIFDGDENLKSVTISKKTKKINGNVLAAIPGNADAFFEGENVIEITKATDQGGIKPLKELEGTYYVDASGVLYKLSSNGEASLAYVPPGIESYSVPEKIKTPGTSGVEYTVTAMEADALYQAEDLDAIDFEKPENVYLKAHAFRGWSTSSDNRGNTVNDGEFITVSNWAGVSQNCDFPLSQDDISAELVESIDQPNDKLSVGVNIKKHDPSEDGVYHYLTGQSAIFEFNVNNEDNITMEKYARIYFEFSESGYELGNFPVGESVLVTDNGAKIPIKVVRTDNPNVYYYELTEVIPGDTVDFKNSFMYPSPGTDGGTLKVWTHIIDEETSNKYEGKVIEPGKYMQVEWSTDPIEFDYAKETSTVYDRDIKGLQTPIVKTDPSGDLYVSSLAYVIKETNKSGSSSVSEGLDNIRWVTYSDEITLPDELYWREGIKEALNSGNWALEDNATSHYNYNSDYQVNGFRAITVTLNGKKYYVAYLRISDGYTARSISGQYTNFIDNLKAKITDDGKLRLTWRVANDSLSGASATNEFKAETFYLRIGENVVMADPVKIDNLLTENPGKKLEELLSISNVTDEVRHYSYSPNMPAHAEAESPVKASYDVVVNKTYRNGDTVSNQERYGGSNEYFDISINNIGILTLSNWGKATKDADGKEVYDGHMVEDSLNYHLYIEPNNIEKMFAQKATLGGKNPDETAPIGDWFTLTISKASLFTENQFQPVDGTDDESIIKYSSNNDSNINYKNDNGARALETATIVFTKDADGKIKATVNGDVSEGGHNGTYVIGAGGDYSSVKSFFDAIGFMPTRNTKYKTDYTLPKGESFRLKPGQKVVFPILSSLKTTPMMLTADKESYYLPPYSSSNSSTYESYNNTATVRLKAGSSTIDKGYTTKYYHRWISELFLYKSGYIENGNLIEGNSSIKDGSVIDTRLIFYNNNGKPYEHMDVADCMDGPQVALAPLLQNLLLKAPDGSDLPVYTSNGVSYYVLNKPGEYKDVTFGSTSGRNGLQSLKADITVTQTISNGKVTNLNTLTKWKPFENWGGTSTQSNIYYKTLVSAEKAGFVSSENPGEAGSYVLNNKAWLGDHQGHRLWDTKGIYTQNYTFSKRIITDDGKKDGTDSASTNTLVGESRVNHGKTVTYQIQIDNTSTSNTILNGRNISDRLPNTYGVFDWEKNVSVSNIRYYATDGVVIKHGSSVIPGDGTTNESSDDCWSIEKSSTKGIYFIRWNNEFNINFPVSGSVKILVDVTFPERTEGVSVWDRYVAANNGRKLENRFYLFDRSSYVTHLLESEGKAVLYKGVVDTGLTTRYQTEYYIDNSAHTSYTSFNSRLVYQNGTGSIIQSDRDLKVSTVTYYTVLYNGGYDRLYLSDMEDQLPRGFKFNCMCNVPYGYSGFTSASGGSGYWTSTSDTAYKGGIYCGYSINRDNGYHSRYGTDCTISEGYKNAKLVTISNANDEFDNNKVKFINARVVCGQSNGADGREHLTFTIKGSPDKNGTVNEGYASDVIKYDSVVGKYYLDPGEAVRFGYNVVVDQYAKTDDEATNTVTMPYYDYYGTGFKLDAPDENGNGGAVQTSYKRTGITDNDGGCTMMSADEVKKQYGINTNRYSADPYNTTTEGLENGHYMVSSVTVHRAQMTPGVQKSVGQGSGSFALKNKADNPSPTTIQGSTYNSDATHLYGDKRYSGAATSNDVIGWRVRVFNESGGSNEDVGAMMTNYKVVDTMDAPYKFTGQVFYNMYRAGSANGTRASASQCLFTLGTRDINSSAVRISAGSSLAQSASSTYPEGWRLLPIGSAEDDNDDVWFTFGKGTREGRVKIELDADGNEVMTIEMKGSSYTIPPGYWYDFCIHTMYPEEGHIISATKYNSVVLYPEQEYNADKVVQGRTRTKQVYDGEGNLVTVNDGIQSGASISISEGYSTTSWKKITEIGNTSNTARSDEPNNYIALSEKDKKFKYDLHVIGPDEVMAKIVLIDDLPHEGDHSAFVDRDLRYSDFSVGFSEDDLNLNVAVANKDGSNEQPIDASLYDVYVTEKVNFTDDDWKGAGEGWTRLNGLSDEEKTAVLKEAKSIRIVIKDPNAWIKQKEDDNNYMMSFEKQIHISFNAKINDKDAQAGEFAWNSFGYKYTVPSTQNGTEENSRKVELEAQPLNVGIKYPCAPVLKKVLTEEAEEESSEAVKHVSQKDLDCKFIIYEGDPLSALNDISEMSEGEIAEALANRNYIYVPLKVKAGSSESEGKGLWTIENCSTYADGKFKDSDQKWTWRDNAKYTLLELNMEDGDIYDLYSISVDGKAFKKNNQAFANDITRKIELKADNRYSDVDLILTKKMPERVDMNIGTGTAANSTVVFKVVGKNKQGEVKYENTVGLSFNGQSGTSETRILKEVPADLEYTVTEAYSGNYKPKDGKTSITKVKVEPYEGDLEEYRGKMVWLFEFENEPDDNDFGSGIVNQYEYKDGKVTYKDDNPQSGEPATEPAEPQE